MRHQATTLLSALSAMFLATSPVLAASPQEDLLSHVKLEIARIEVSVMSADQLEAMIQYLVECRPYPSTQRDARCERAYTMLGIKSSNAKNLDALRMGVYVLDKLSPWEKASRTQTEERLIERRGKIFSELEEAAAIRHQTLREKSQ